jgi:hypothetical protein
MTKTAFGTFGELLADAAVPLRPVISRLREIVYEVDADSVEVVRLGDRAATYGVGPKKMSEAYAYVLPYAEWVNVGFFYATSLPDPDDLLEGSGAKMRHVKVRSLGEADAQAIRTLIEAAVAERRASLGR